jgi:uncharacterized phage infection (PIP) family protein YhgE
MRVITDLQSRNAALSERLQLVDPSAQKRQLIDARQQMMLLKDQSDELSSQLRRENGKLHDEAENGRRNQQLLHQQMDQLSKKLADTQAKYEVMTSLRSD